MSGWPASQIVDKRKMQGLYWKFVWGRDMASWLLPVLFNMRYYENTDIGGDMKWSTIRNQHPDKFILIGDIIEKKISESHSMILEGEILKVSDSGKEIRDAYMQFKKKGVEVLYSLPTTPDEFIIENVPYKGILR